MKEVLLKAFDVERKLPVNLDQEDLPLFEHELNKKFGEAYIRTLHNAYILNDLVFKPFKFYIPQSLSYPMVRREQFKRLNYLFKPGKTYDKCIWITDDWSGGYFHWLMDALPRLMLSKHRMDHHKVLLHESYKSLKYILETLEMLGFDFVFYSGKCKVKELLLPDHIAVSGNYYIPVFRAIREKLLKKIPAGIAHRKVYVRRKHTRFRKLVNEEEFNALVTKFDFEIHDFENYTLTEQLQLMQETKYLIGLHGNALTNIYFMQEQTKVLELRFKDDSIGNCFFAMAAANNIDYYYQIGIGTSADTHVADMVVDIKEAENNIALMLAD